MTLNTEARVGIPRPPASPTYATGPGVFNLWLPGVWHRRRVAHPLTRGGTVLHPGCRRHQLMQQGRASSTCGCQGFGAGAFTLPLNTEAMVGAPRPPASATYVTGPGVFNLWLARPPAPLTYATASGASWACNVRLPRPIVCARCWVPGVWCRRTQLTLNTVAMFAAARPPASLTYATGGSCQLRPSRWRHHLMPPATGTHTHTHMA